MTVDAIAVVQARMGSSRLPGKVLADLDGVPMLRFMLDRLSSAPVDLIVVATSTDERDDPVVEIATAAGVAIVRGPEQDVLRRYAIALDAHPAETVVRLTADCPLTDPGLVSTALTRHRETGADYTSNTLVRTFPDGLDVEVVQASALRAADAEAVDVVEREHVTPFVYRRPERFELAAFTCDRFLGDERWTVDDAEDLAFLRWLVAALGRHDFPWPDAVDLAKTRRRRSPGPRLVPAGDSTPARRRWDLHDHAAGVGEVTLSVRTGLGEAELRVPPAAADDALRLLHDRLQADAQVVSLSINR
jgi:spore coat polysaccharide biosynthesis protein SpsF